MNIEIRHERKRLLADLDKLEIQRCGICKDVPSNRKMVHCDCPAAVGIRKIGKKLIKTVGKRRNEELEDVVNRIKGESLTVDSYKQLKEMNKTDKEICKLIGWYYAKMVDFKYENGLSKRKGPAQIDFTKEHKQIAESNGIPMALVRKRMRVYGWELDRAITETLNSRKKDFGKWLDVAKANGLAKKTFSARLAQGMTMEEAATRPKGAHSRRNSKYSAEMIELANSNGVSYETFIKRINEYGWDQQRAATQPPKKMNREEVLV